MKTAPGLPANPLAVGVLSLSLLVLAACGGEGGDAPATGSASEPEPSGGLTAAQLENGVGPIESIELGAIDDALAASGEETFLVKCSACHKMAERYVGPPLGDVLERRTPEFVMNMILNPEGMVAEHPEVRAMLAQYAVPMANQNLTEEEARAVLEYLRTQGGPNSTP